jgi:putative PIN family toxin of toxin-antitoxin system
VTRAVIDTSVLIRYLVRPGAAVRELIERHWVDGDFVMVTSPELLDELADVLARPRIQNVVHAADGAALLESIRAHADIIPPIEAIPEYTRDRKDDKFVACAIAGRADYVVTTDEDMLVLGELAGVRFVTPYAFVNELASAPKSADPSA